MHLLIRTILLLASPLAVAALHANPGAELWRDGHQAGEWKQIQSAVDAAQPGDVIRIRGGVYHENIVIRGKHSSAEAPFVLEAVEGEAVILDGADPELQVAGSGRWKWNEEAKAWIAEVPWGGNPDRALLTWASHANGRLIAAHHNREFFLARPRGDALWRTGETVRLRLADDGNPNQIPLNVGTAEGIIQFYDSSGWIVRNLTLKHAGFAGVHLNGPTVSDIVLDGLTIKTAFRGISTEDYKVGFSHRITIRNCRIHNFWDFDWAWRHGYRDHTTSSDDENAPVRGGGIHLRAHDSSIQYCEIAGQWDGIRIQGRNVEARGNLLHHIKDDMFELESNNSSDVRVFENVGFNIFAGFSVVSNRGGPIYIYRNRVQTGLRSRMFDDVWRYGYPLKFGNDWGPGAENIFIYHNTFDSEGRSVFVGRGSNPEKWSDIEWVNNVFNRTQKGALGLELMAKPSQGIVWEGNLFVRGAELNRLIEFSEDFTEAGWVGAPALLAPDQQPPDLRVGAQSDARALGTRRAIENGWPDTFPYSADRPDAGAVPYGEEAPKAGTEKPLYLPWKTEENASQLGPNVTESLFRHAFDMPSALFFCYHSFFRAWAGQPTAILEQKSRQEILTPKTQ